ncbi:type 1 fimbrial protein [Escherichia coli]|uniref:Type 1 fimbrial protein n=1 Tax=Escherichia coli TaxID=562 RepID=A0AAI9FD88_ECOLX|nr:MULTISPECIES: fimbrial protein [Escherichia]HDQ6534953.1 type 1 fimbrial protein [Escherichia coli O36:H14]ANO88405.1 fimbrial protein [Escherichia coli]EFB2825334.1 type 1 fimbrial protein [Escherichia coli]EFI6952420.1 type 1 fimbrial protein [Escherichia coli]EFN1900367.1 type 1 fimbrial protein [Escherichia coli]
MITQRSATIFTLLVTLWPLCAFHSAQAADININGTVVASACVIDTQTKDQTVRFEQARAVNYDTVGHTSEWQNFSLNLSSCPASTSSVTALFTGESDLVDQTKFANTLGDATGMALQIMTDDHITEISPNGKMTVNVDQASRKATFPLAARMYTPTGTVTAGEFHTVVQFTFTYQ